jgi:hypothetical protein
MTPRARVRLALGIGAIATGASAPAAFAAVQPGTQIHTERYGIRFKESALDLGAPGPGLGDVQILNDRLVEGAEHHAVPELAAARKVAPITGGIKGYRGIRGELVLTEGANQTGTIVFRFTRTGGDR